MFRVGQKVVCVDDSNSDGYSTRIVRGEVYEIAGLNVIYDTTYIRIYRDVSDNGWRASRFRPVVDIGWAHEIVARVLKRDKVRA